MMLQEKVLVTPIVAGRALRVRKKQARTRKRL